MAETVRSIDCRDCVMQGTRACGDCVVTFVVNREPGEAVVLDAAEERTLRLLTGAGMVPRLRYVAGDAEQAEAAG